MINYNEHIKSLFTDNTVHKIFGPAGTGKTTYLINELKQLFKDGVPAERIAFVSFTNKAVTELVERCSVEFPHLTKEQFQYFKTIHSICYRFSDNKKVITQTALNQLARDNGLEVSAFKSVEEGFGAKSGDQAITIENLSRLRMVSTKEQWGVCDFPDLPFYKMQQWSEAYSSYKKEQGVIDFTDMLETFKHTLDVDYIFIDECQDLSPLQWEVMSIACGGARKVYLAGDDDQSIYDWAGAEIDYILNIKADKDVVLPKSYRIPKAVFKISSKILKRIKKRKDKKYTHNGKKGVVDSVYDFKRVDYKAESDCLVLARNRWQLKEVKEYLEEQGLPYMLYGAWSNRGDDVEAIKMWEALRKGRDLTPRQFKAICKFSSKLNKFISQSQIPKNILDKDWMITLDLIKMERRQYIRRILANRYNLNAKPTIAISTIHQAKGGEAETVVLLTDVSYTVWKDSYRDGEHRVWYVAVTRTKNKLIIVQEQGNQYYRI